MPWNCAFCYQGFRAMEHVSEEARKQGLMLIEMQKENAMRNPVWEALATEDPIFINGFGHGRNDLYTGDSSGVAGTIFSTRDCDILAGRIIYLLSCLTANELGPAIIAVGGIAYGGYKIAWTWLTQASSVEDVDPYTDWYGEGFYRGSNEFPIALIQGDPVWKAKERCIAEYNRWINIWETERADDPSSATAIKWLLHDRNGLVVLGDESAYIVLLGIKTVLTVETQPTTHLQPSENMVFEGTLKEAETGAVIPNREIRLMLFGQPTPVATTMTDGDGRWSFTTPLAKGHQIVYTVFEGDETYGCVFSPRFLVEVATTRLTVQVKPKGYVETGETINFAGMLSEEAVGTALAGKTVNLFQEGIEAPLMSMVTDGDGRWAFSITFTEMDRIILYAEFLGDVDYVDSKTADYMVGVGTLPIFGYDLRGGVLLGFANRLMGSRFTALDSGTAMNIVAFQQYGVYAGKHKCALYRASDMKLLGVTEEKEYPGGAMKTEWVSFAFLSPVPIEAGTEYILIEWASMVAVAYMEEATPPRRYTYDLEYDSFPDPLPIEEWYYTFGTISIYCEYLPAEIEEHGLTVNSSPSGVPVAVDKINVGDTPVNVILIEGEHIIEVPETLEV